MVERSVGFQKLWGALSGGQHALCRLYRVSVLEELHVPWCRVAMADFHVYEILQGLNMLLGNNESVYTKMSDVMHDFIQKACIALFKFTEG